MAKDPGAMTAARHALGGAVRGVADMATAASQVPGVGFGDIASASVPAGFMGAVGGLANYAIDRGLGYIGNQITNARSTARVNEAAQLTDFSQPSQVHDLTRTWGKEQNIRAMAPNTLTGYLWGGLKSLFNDETKPAFQTASTALDLNQEPSYAQDPVNRAAAMIEKNAKIGPFSLGRRDPATPTIGSRSETTGAAFGDPSRGFDNGVEAGTGYVTGYVAGQPAQRFGPPQTPVTKPAQPSTTGGDIAASGRIGSQPGGGYGPGGGWGGFGRGFGIGGQGGRDIGGFGRIGSQPGGGYGGFGGFGGGGSGGGGASVGGQGGAGIGSDSESGGHGW
jgi:hypothetical protein